MEYPLPALLALPGGDDHAGVGDSDADTGHQLGESVVVDAVCKGAGVDVIGVTKAGYADGVGAYAEGCLQVLGVHEKAGELVAVFVQTEEDADAHIVDPSFHGAVHGRRVVVIVVLGPCGVELEITLFVVGLLEEDVGADACLLEKPVVVHGGGGNIDVDPADGAVFMFDAVDGVDAVQVVVHGVVDRVLPRFQGQALVAHVLEGDDLSFDLLLGELLSGNMFVLAVVRTVGAAVDAVVGQIQRGEHDNAVAVEVFLDLLCQPVDFLVLLLNVAVQKNGGLSVGETFSLFCLLDDLCDQGFIVLVLLRKGKRLQDFLVIDKVVRVFGIYIIHFFHPPWGKSLPVREGRIFTPDQGRDASRPCGLLCGNRSVPCAWQVPKAPPLTRPLCPACCCRVNSPFCGIWGRGLA